jgi:hypothetical protein
VGARRPGGEGGLIAGGATAATREDVALSPARAPAGHAGGLLALNAGSSSLKFALFDAAAPDGEARLRGQVEGLGEAAHLIARDGEGHTTAEQRWPAERKLTHEDVLPKVLDLARQAAGAGGVAAIGHRIVHGGREFTAPVRLDTRVIEALDALSPLAPLHQPHNLAAVRAAMKADPGVPQVACFDTAFHATQPAVATRLALTRELEDEGVRRYGFHGLSYEYIARRLRRIDPPLAEGRVIVAHLGSGASLCALAAGRSLDTTMGFTAVDGLVMGTRCGTTDPGAILYLVQALGWTAGQVEDLIWRRSGLLGRRRAPAGPRGGRAVRLAPGARGGGPGQQPGRPGRPRLHRRHRRAQPRGPRRRLRAPGLAGRGPGRGGQRGGGRRDQHASEPGVGAGDPHGRGADDRDPYGGGGGVRGEEANGGTSVARRRSHSDQPELGMPSLMSTMCWSSALLA